MSGYQGRGRTKRRSNCHNVAEAAARAIGPAEAFASLKGVILAKLLEEAQLRKALLPLPSEAVIV